MNKILLSTIITVCVFNFSSAQTTNSAFDFFNTTNNSQVTIPTTNNSTTQISNASQNSVTVTNNAVNSNSFNQQIPQNVLSVINEIKSKYNLNQAQVNSLNQISRSYQYIINNPPKNKAEAFTLSTRDVASTNCASTRIVGIALEEAVNKIELASLDTQVKIDIYQNYTNLLDENNPNPQIVDSCEDEFSQVNTNNGNTPNNNFQINLNGIIPDQNIVSKCLILTHFMEFGSRDSQVFPLQNFLMENGYLEMYPTRFFGRNTEFAVKEWQKRHGVDVRGWAGPNTRASIASITCKTQAAADKAFKGEIVKKYVAVKKVLAKTPLQQPIKTKVIVIATTTEEVAFKPIPSTSVSTNNLSSLGSTFYLKRSPVNTLYFTYKANTTLDDVYMCISKVGNSKCESSNNFAKIKQKYEPGNIDTINNNTKWIFNVYYNADNWGTEGGAIYLRNGIGNISEVYSVKVIDSL